MQHKYHKREATHQSTTLTPKIKHKLSNTIKWKTRH